jgi:hypothetical protein
MSVVSPSAVSKYADDAAARPIRALAKSKMCEAAPGYGKIPPGAALLQTLLNPNIRDIAMITITDLPVSRALDVKAMSSLRGADGAPWVFAFQPPSAFVPSVTNFFQINNNFTYIDKMVNQTTILNIENSGNNANLTAVLLGSQGA